MSNSYESYTSLIPVNTSQEEEPEVETATAGFPLQHTVLSALTEHVNLDRNPTYGMFDSGCTRDIGSRYAVNRLIKAVERYAPGEIEFTFFPSHTKFSLADSETALITGVSVCDSSKPHLLVTLSSKLLTEVVSLPCALSNT